MRLTRLALALAITLGAADAQPASSGAVTSSIADRPGLTVELDRVAVSTRVGDHVTFSTTLRNTGQESLHGLVAHLNIVSLDPAVYVDPEDWSSQRTRYLAALQAGQATKVSWSVQAVNAGHFLLYVAIASKDGTDAIATTSALRAAVTARRTINPGGILPVAVAVPAALLLLWGTTTLRRRRRRQVDRSLR